MFSSQLIKQRLTRRRMLQVLAGASVAGGSIATLQYYLSAREGDIGPTVGQTVFTYHGHSTGDDSGVVDVAWSPDSKMVARQ